MPTQTFRTSKSFSTALTHIARLRFKGNHYKQADGHVLSSDNVRQQPPIKRGVFGGISSELKSKTPRILEVFSSISVPSREPKLGTNYCPLVTSYVGRSCTNGPTVWRKITAKRVTIDTDTLEP